MKKIRIFSLLSIFFIGASSAWAQREHPLLNLEHFDEKPLQWGYYFGANLFDFKFNYEKLDYTTRTIREIRTEKNWGFNVGLSGSMRLAKFLDLRIEPGLVYNKRNLYFPGMEEKRDQLREVKSTYIYIPLLLKFSSARWYNFKPYLTAGGSMAINLSSNYNLNIDNYEGIFRTQRSVFFYELGIGFDIYTPFFRLSPSIRGLFSINNELIPDNNAASPWTSNLSKIKSRGFLINLTFE
ncbi:porin family protein [Capnocytophaga sp.]|uniref:type IX secretion/gliding motility protein PorT/SprT n=1 Tax=Capnocytophaga sp. TaxID=44737 RepID=UPI0026DC1767|nr:porin family protein [Capnocytophaga sp.]MDO5105087.1 porin family protein [Capnocytophaga sp.]